jgi:hypothetical protein
MIPNFNSNINNNDVLDNVLLPLWLKKSHYDHDTQYKSM